MRADRLANAGGATSVNANASRAAVERLCMRSRLVASVGLCVTHAASIACVEIDARTRRFVRLDLLPAPGPHGMARRARAFSAHGAPCPAPPSARARMLDPRA